MHSPDFFRAEAKGRQIPSGSIQKHEATSNIIFNLAQMGISLRDASFIEVDTYFELVDLFHESMSSEPSARVASQADIDRFLL